MIVFMSLEYQMKTRDTIYNIDIYLLSQAPIYEYGEEILEAN